MNKISDLASALVTKYDLTQKEAELFVTYMFDVINSGLQNNDKQVKVKGLGTFKIQSVNARESVNVNNGRRIIIEGRNKISFTPETSLKNRVNQPFAQFETVIINDGVDFSDMDNSDISEDVNYDDEQRTDDEQRINDEPRIDDVPQEVRNNDLEDKDVNADDNVENVPEEIETVEDTPENDAPQEDTDNVEQPDIMTEPTIAEPAEEQSDVVIESDHPEEERVVDDCVAHTDNDVQPEKIEASDDESRNASGKRNNIIILLISVIIILCGCGIYGIFYYQKQILLREDRILELEIIIDNFQTKIQKKTLEAESQKVIKNNQTEKTTADADSIKKPVAKTDDKGNSDFEKYNKDIRIRTGAYNIVGIAQTITLKEGQSLAYISKKYLGPGMECYIEAVNEDKAFEAGEKINIPKLKLKKR